MKFVNDIGYIHLDIKPSNFLVGNAGIVKIADFELCYCLKNPIANEGHDFFEGDSKYLAPEVLKTSSNLANLSYKCDIFSMGLSFAEILFKVDLPQSGRLWEKIRSPNFSFDNEQIYHSNLKDTIDSNLIKLIYSMIEVDEIKRPTIGQLFDYFGELYSRNVKLLKNQYIRIFTPTDFFDNESNVNILLINN